MSISGRSGSYQKNTHIIRLSVAILTAYAVCIGPMFVLIFLRIFLWHWQNPPICAFQTVIPFVSRFMAYSWSAINPFICFCFSKNYRSGLKEIITARAGTSSLRMTTGITSLRKRATSSGSEFICLRVIEQDQGDEKRRRTRGRGGASMRQKERRN